jgi:hypothetical protein
LRAPSHVDPDTSDGQFASSRGAPIMADYDDLREPRRTPVERSDPFGNGARQICCGADRLAYVNPPIRGVSTTCSRHAAACSTPAWLSICASRLRA